MPSIRPHHVTRVLLAVLIAAFIVSVVRHGSAGPVVGEAPPDFQLMDLDGRTVQLSDYRGKVTVINFWATWCPPCVEEMPSLNQFQQAFSPKGVVVLAVSVDDDEAALRRFVRDHRLAMTVIRDPGRKVASLYQTYRYPETYILDRSGKLVKKIVGPADWNDPRVTSVVEQLTSPS